MAIELGELKKVRIREAWKHEEQDFTPWLAGEENIRRLSEALGLELQVEGIEVAVGPFSADILAKDSSGAFVVIENQFGKTDHDHLGKVLTYAAALGATSVVWVAENFTDEHRKAVEWLNDRTTEELNVYAVEIELWRVDDSKPAVRFSVLSQPSELTRQAAAAKYSGQLTESQKLQFDFWTQVRERLLEKKVLQSAQTARPQYWYDVPLGKSHIHLSNTANTWDNRIGVRVYVGNQVAEKALPQLLAQRDAIEKELGEKLEWNPNPDKRDKVIILARDADLRNRDAWPEYIDWMTDRIARFRKVFAPRVKALDLTETASDK